MTFNSSLQLPVVEVHALAWLHPAVVVWPPLPFSLEDRLQSDRKLHQLIQPSGSQCTPIRGKSCLPGEVCAIMVLPVCYYSLNVWFLRCDFFASLACFSFCSLKHITVFVTCVAQRGQFGRMKSLGHRPHCHLPLHGTWLWRCWEFLHPILVAQVTQAKSMPIWDKWPFKPLRFDSVYFIHKGSVEKWNWQ